MPDDQPADDTRPLVAPDTRLLFAPDTRRLGPGLVSGGSPWRLLRLTDVGDRWIDRWRVGQAVPEGLGARRLATRLVDAGLASSRPRPGGRPSVTVVVPCRDRDAGLTATLGALDPDCDVVVVDDGSALPAATAHVVAGRPRTRLVRRAMSGGPAAARDDGWQLGGDDRAGCDDDGLGVGASMLVAFLDADCLPPPGWLADLAGHFQDPTVGAVAPRIEARPTPGTPRWLLAYEEVRSPLDLGRRPAPVHPRSRVPYVPTAALVVRRAALVDLGGFDHHLPTGEDVDLVWRLGAAGWRVRYDPSVVVGHPVRPSLRSWVAQRAGYGRSAAPLAARHGRAVAPLSISKWSAAAWMLGGLGHPLAGLAVAAASTARLVAKAAPPPPAGRDRPRPGRRGTTAASVSSAEIARLAGWGHVRAGRGLADAIRRTWWPLAAVTAVVCRRSRPMFVAAVVVPPLIEWHERRPALGRAAWVALRLADDLAYGTGVWDGVLRERRVRCLLPDLH